MTTKAKALINVRKLTGAALINYVLFILECMTGNINFTNPTPKLLDIKAILDSFTAALRDAESRDRVKVGIKNTLRAQLDDLIQQLGTYVNVVSNGDLDIILSSGFKTAKQRDPSSQRFKELLV